MESKDFPITLARAGMRFMPPRLLERTARLLLRRMERHHPELFAGVQALPPTTLVIETTDLPHRFVLRFGEKPLSISLLHGTLEADAELKGSLAAMIALLEGRVDSDVLFFTRELAVTGNSAAVVALRNTLERDDIDLLEEAASVAGPLHRPARKALLRLDRVAQKLRAKLAPPPEPAPPPRSLIAERDRLRSEVAGLKARMAKMEQQQRRRAGAASA